jgi:hypothetical protein
VRQGIRCRLGDVVKVKRDGIATGMNDSPMPRPKLLLVVSLAAIMALYLLYLASNIDLFIEKRMAPAPPVMTATQEMPQSDFARFWFVGKSVTLKRAAAFGHQLAAPADFAATYFVSQNTSKIHLALPANNDAFGDPVCHVALGVELLGLAICNLRCCGLIASCGRAQLAGDCKRVVKPCGDP